MMGTRVLATVLLSSLALFVRAAPVRGAADAVVLVWQSSGAPADVNDGVRMGASEAQQTAKLLGRDVRLEPRAARPFAAIVQDSRGVSLESGHCTFKLAPSAAERAAILSDWKQRNGRDGDYRVAVWHSSLKQFGGVDLNERFTRQFHAPMTEGGWLGWVAVKAAVEAALRSNAPACAAIRDIQFDGHKGALLSFRNGVLQQPLYVIENAGGAEKVVGQVPEK
jgi:hypothetical protein